MSAILAIETSSELASVAFLRDGQLIVRECSGVQTHSQSVLPMVQQVLKEAGIALAGCDAIAFGAGPGSFTGVRTACGVAQGLSFGADLPTVPVVTLMAMAQACRERTDEQDVLVALDARMEEVYWAQYRYQDDEGKRGWHVVTAPRLSAAADVAPVGSPALCGNGLSAYASAFAPLLAAHRALPDIVPHAAQVARLAAVAYAEGLTVPAREVQPLYLRNKVAFTSAERAAKAAA